MTAIAWQWTWPGLNTPLLVSQEVASLLESYRQKHFDVERGGQLFVDPSSAVGLVLAVATTPHKDDRAGRAWLDLNARRCRKEIEQANAAGLRLVGYWHTHPQSIPMISPTDIGSFSRFAAEGGASSAPRALVMISRMATIMSCARGRLRRCMVEPPRSGK